MQKNMADIVYEDNHIIVVNKHTGEIVQGDKTGDEPLVETLKNTLRRNMPNQAMCSAGWFTGSTAP